MSNSEELRPWRFEPDALSQEDPQQNQTSQQELIPPATEWCVCKRCQDMPSLPECLRCRDAEFVHHLHDREEHECLCMHPGVDEPMVPAPLELRWNNYLRYHNNLFHFGELSPNARKKLCACCNLVFWLMPQIRRGERRPLPACLVSKIRALFPPTDDEEKFADYVFFDSSNWAILAWFELST
ncbi:uncharacterized protein [Watersipora subatra]|uniref:uncharacterized protein n=1 Tax=Watersipora subatra TaxID=2589382 RepID=UPI00355B597F